MLRYGTGAVRRLFEASCECVSRQYERADQTPLIGGSKTRSTRPRSRQCGRRVSFLALMLSERKPGVPLRAKRFATRAQWKRATEERRRSRRLEARGARAGHAI